MPDDLFWTYPLRLAINEDGKTVCDLLDKYKCFLETYHFEHCKSFHELCCTEPEAARAEAIVFSFFQWNGYDIQVEETSSEGGVDFRAKKDNTEFVIEVTSIRRETFTKRSGIPENPWMSGKSSYYVGTYKVAKLIRSEVSGKAKQMSGYDCPRILIIACEHPEYSTFLKKEKGGLGAEMFLTSPPVLGLPDLNNVTYLDDSLFFRFQQNGKICFCRKSISAVLLFYISKYHLEAIGLLHPKPAHKFSIEFLPSIPFVKVLGPKIKDQPVDNNDKVRTIWIPDNLPDGAFIYNHWC